MSIKPILFKTEMVRAIMDGRKTVTRRCVKPPGGIEDVFGHMNECKQPCQPGDILYVRETYCWCPCWDCGMDTEEGCCDDIAHKFYNEDRKEYGCYGYKASWADGDEPFERWHPSIHMPKEAARIWLKVTDVRVERLQDITDDDAIKEGANYKNGKNVGFEEKMRRTAVERYEEIWASTIKKQEIDNYGWDANPWVWVIEFERCEKYAEKGN